MAEFYYAGTESPFERARGPREDEPPVGLDAADDTTLERMQGVVIEHLRRFAFREDFGDVQWTKS